MDPLTIAVNNGTAQPLQEFTGFTKKADSVPSC